MQQQQQQQYAAAVLCIKHCFIFLQYQLSDGALPARPEHSPLEYFE
jgi:hypothetical protein